MRSGRFVGGDRVKVGRERARRHAARIACARRAVEPDADLVQVHERPPVALGIDLPAGKQADEVASRDDAALDVGVAAKLSDRKRPQATERRTSSSMTPAMRSAWAMAARTRLLGLVEIGDDAGS